MSNDVADNDRSDKAAAPLDEQLVAYLDGELDADSARRIEALLASDPEARLRLQRLERTWDMLDELETAPVGEPFTRTTLEMVAIAANKDVELRRADAPRRARHRRFVLIGGLLTAVVAGFVAVAVFLPAPDRQLLRDLPVVENYDEYRQVESVAFLRELRNGRLFPGGKASPAADAKESESPAERRRRVEAMDPFDKEQLLHTNERFLALKPKEQERLRRLHDDLQTAPDASQLRQTMQRYVEWLKTLSSYSRAEMAEMDVDQRVAEVRRRLKEEQAREGSRRPTGKDALAILVWMNDFAARHERQFLKTMSEPQRKQIASLGEPMRRGAFWVAWQRAFAADPSSSPPWATDEDLRRLRAGLSDEARNRLETLPPAKQWQRVAAWIRQGLRHRAMGMHGPLPKADDERMANFFENELTDEQRDRLLNLPGDEMQRELQRMFLSRTRPFEKGGVGPRPNDHQRHSTPQRGDGKTPKE